MRPTTLRMARRYLAFRAALFGAKAREIKAVKAPVLGKHRRGASAQRPHRDRRGEWEKHRKATPEAEPASRNQPQEQRGRT